MNKFATTPSDDATPFHRVPAILTLVPPLRLQAVPIRYRPFNSPGQGALARVRNASELEWMRADRRR